MLDMLETFHLQDGDFYELNLNFFCIFGILTECLTSLLIYLTVFLLSTTSFRTLSMWNDDSCGHRLIRLLELCNTSDEFSS